MTDGNFYDQRSSNNIGSVSGGENHFNAYPTSTSQGTRATEDRPVPKNRTVFIAHGRDLAARNAIFGFLRALDLRPLAWETIVDHTGQAAPHVLDVVRQGFEEAAAAVVLLTPDDISYLHETLRHPEDGDRESAPSGQPRQNVLFEAGMAMALHQDRTVLVRIGPVRPFTDIDGLDVVQILGTDGIPGKLKNIAARLRRAGCEVDLTGDDWIDDSAFRRLATLHRRP